ncbi:potassium channel family protein [Methanococcus voltae]|uniref:TrkA-N domain protein n=1 Tax=Methanococcus voltae (strain ATCC BAA-1334 / A3) TaxID=456320 RepID=D7DV99_METV3|nr:potassium channel protein [Methanococcus voltae]MCS3901898.1 voltage-gated potassium channel [Methanococcus voltae]
MEPIKKIKIGLFVIFFIVMFFSISFSYFESLSMFDSFYLTIITMFTIGYGDIHPITYMGRLTAILLALTGTSVGLFTFGSTLQLFVEGYFRKANRMRNMKNRIKNMKDHYVLCGYGRIGKVVANRLAKRGADFVVLDLSEENLVSEFEKNPEFNYICGDATLDECLIEANIKNAKTLISTMPRDSDNVFVTLSAKRLNPNIHVVSKAEETVSMDKLLIAGADKVVSPYMIGGMRLAELAIKPDVLDFFSTFMSIANYEYNEDIDLRKYNILKKYEGISIFDLLTQINYNVSIIGIKSKNGSLNVNPAKDTILHLDDQIYVFGTYDQLESFEQFIN